MKLNKIFIITAVIIFALSANIQAQKARLYKANLLYDAMAYAEAIPKYAKVLKKDTANADAMIKFADCYRKINDIQNAIKIYGEIIKKGLGLPIHKLYYAQALMSASNYEEAKKYMAEYNADSRGETFTKAMEDMNKFFKDSAYYTIETLPFNSKFNDFSPRILNKKIVFASSRKRAYMENHINAWTNEGFFKLYYTIKKDNEKYSCVHSFPHSLDNRFNSGPVSFSRQSNTVYLTRNNIVDTKPVFAQDGQVKLQIYAASMNKKCTSYQYLLDFQYNNKEYNFMHPAISDDGTRLYFVSDMPGGIGGTDLWMSTKENDKWTSPKNLGKAVNTEGNEAFPFIKDKILYFSSNGLEGIGGMDIFKVPLDDKGIPSGKPYNLGVPMNSPGDDFGVVFNDEGNKGYFSSNRKELNIDDDIYGFTYSKKDILISGVTADAKSGEVINQTNVTLVNKNNEVVEEVNTNENGNFSFIALLDEEYTIKGIKDDYFEAAKAVSTVMEVKTNEIKTDLGLDKDPGLKLSIIVSDSRTKAPINNVSIEITDKDNGKKYKYSTTNTGEYTGLLPDKKIGDKINYAVKLTKDGYYNTNNIFTYNISEKGTIKMQQSMDMIMDIEPVYFDYDKYDIRADASAKLDNVVEILKENPAWYIELYSYTDCRGTEKYNIDLSGKRAQSTVEYLRNKGISQNRIVGKGKGIAQMAADCDCKKGPKSNCTEEQYQLNRRTEFVIKK